MSERLFSTIGHINKGEKWGYVRKVDQKQSRDYAFYPESFNDSKDSKFDSLQVDDQVSFVLEEKKGLFKACDMKIIQKEEAPFIENSELNSGKDFLKEKTSYTDYLKGKEKYYDSDLIIGLVGALGVKASLITDSLKKIIREKFNYEVEIITIPKFIDPDHLNFKGTDEEKMRRLIDMGNIHREKSGNFILAAAAVNSISTVRNDDKKTVFIVDSLKRPEEVEFLKKIYGSGFYLIGLHNSKEVRESYLYSKGINEKSTEELIQTDEDEDSDYGQKTRSTFHLSDFFLDLSKADEKNIHVNNSINRFLELIFSNPFLNPTFDEQAMFMAFNSSVRSGDLSRQVGAVLSKDQKIIATGANEVPKSGGGLYWSEDSEGNGNIADKPGTKDHTLGYDSNKKTQQDIISKIIEDIKNSNLISIQNISHSKEDESNQESEPNKELREILKKSEIKDLTEFGRVVHAEMEALLSCCREGVSTVGTTLYCTTFPCHNCAKHIIASGVERVVYVEPYPKSKAKEFHAESIAFRFMNDKIEDGKVTFEPFIGVSSRRFLDLFSMSLGNGFKLKRKDEDGMNLRWEKAIRSPLIRESYQELEKSAITIWDEHVKKFNYK